MFWSYVVDEVLANGVPESRYSLVLYIRLIEQLHGPTNVCTENVHGVASLAKGWIRRGIGAVDLIADGGIALSAAIQPDLQIV